MGQRVVKLVDAPSRKSASTPFASLDERPTLSLNPHTPKIYCTMDDSGSIKSSETLAHTQFMDHQDVS